MGLLQIVLIGGGAFIGFVAAKRYVQRRLRFVDAVRGPIAPVVAGGLGFLVAWPLTLLPLVTLTTAAVFGIAVGAGTASGVKALNRGEHYSHQLRP
jgi:hypothetical protein